MARSKKLSKKITQEIWAVVFVCLGILLFLSLSNNLGEAGKWINIFSLRLFGSGVWVFPFILLATGISLFLNTLIKWSMYSLLGILLLFFSIEGLLHISAVDISQMNQALVVGGGMFGVASSVLFRTLLGDVGATIVLVSFLLIGLLIAFQTSLSDVMKKIWAGLLFLFQPAPKTKAEIRKEKAAEKREKKEQEKLFKAEEKKRIAEEKLQAKQAEKQLLENSILTTEKVENYENSNDDNYENSSEEKENNLFRINRGENNENNENSKNKTNEISEINEEKIKEIPEKKEVRPEDQDFSSWEKPTFDLLEDGNSIVHVPDKELHEIGQKIVEKLAHFKIGVRMDSAFVGPTVTQFALQPDETVKLSKITSLKSELALSLSAESVRIEAPIPGKNLVGIEIPNKKRSTVLMKEVITNSAFKNASGKLRLCLGKDVSGESIVQSLDEMPHLLIAGSTGSGKSVGMNAFLISMLFENSPADLRFIMVDPKRVELMPYEGIPHLLTPVITDASKALSALRWCVSEMMRRLDEFAKVGARNIAEYNDAMLERAEKEEKKWETLSQKLQKKIETEFRKEMFPDLSSVQYEEMKKTQSDEDREMLEDTLKLRLAEDLKKELGEKKNWKKIPKIVIIIDELADLMMREHKKETEAMICRIAQMARAVGMHLVIATQRPSVDVITGLIKANIPTRIAFTVTSAIDSRTVLDSMGAEDLLGRGDMLYTSPQLSRPKRIQGIYISGKEIERVVNHLKIKISDEDFFADHISLDEAPDVVDVPGFNPKPKGGGDALTEEAIEVIKSTGKASASLLQRRLSVGYARAARILDEMEEAGYIGPSKGAKARDIFL